MKCHLIISLFLSIVFSAQSQAEQSVYYKVPLKPKCQDKVIEFTESLGPSLESIKVWVFFTNKAVKSKEELWRALVESKTSFPERTLKRRSKVRPPDQLVDYQDLPVFSEYISHVLQNGAKHRATSRWLNGISVEANRQQIQQIEKLPFVHEIRAVVKFKRKKVEYKGDSFSKVRSLHKQNVSELDYGRSFAQLEQMRVPILHQLGYSGQGVLLCMLDTGFYKEHESFQHLNILAERDFVFDDNDTQTNPNDPNDSSDHHGTLTLSVAGGFKEGQLIGPAFGVDVILAKTEDTRGETPVEEDYWVEGIEWADSLGADVVSSSLAYDNWYSFSDFDGNTAVTTRAADRAASLGIVVVNAAGNYRHTTGHISAPADGDSVITVGAVDSTGILASFSSPGPTYDGRIKPDVCAQGVDTRCAVGGQLATRSPTGYGRAGGTSLSTPLVAGVAALLLEIHPEWGPWDVINALRSTASQNENPDNDYGWGIVNAFRAANIKVPYVIFTDYSVDDDSLESSQGNGNGTVEPGEQVELSITVVNLSDNTGSNDAVASLKTEDPYVSFIQSEVELGTILPGESAITQHPFVFRMSSSAPDSHVVLFQLDVSDIDGNLATSHFKLPIVKYWAVKGIVVDAGTGGAVENVQLAITGPLNETGSILSDEVKTGRTAVNGQYEFLLPEGQYAIQAKARGYLTPNAKVFKLPQDTVDLDFQLAAPALHIDIDSVVTTTTLGDSFNQEMIFTNTGSGSLFFSVLEVLERDHSVNSDKNIHALFNLIPGKLGRYPQMKVVETAPSPVDSLWQLLYTTSDDGTQLCMKECYAQRNENYIYFKLTGYRNWGDVTNWELDFFLDTDANAKSGDNSNAIIGTEYLLSAGSRGTVLLKWTGEGYKFMDFLSYAKVTGDVCELGAKYSQLGIIGSNAGQVNMLAFLLEDREGGEKVLRDILPDDGGLSFIPYSFFGSGWIDVVPSWGVLQAGQSQTVHINLDASQLNFGQYRSFLLAVSNQVAGPLKYIPVEFDIVTGISKRVKEHLPKSFKLYPNNPNPFNPGTTINYALSNSSHIRLEVFNVLGQKVATLVDEHKLAGNHTFHWNGKDTSNQEVPAGIYFCCLVAEGDFKKTQKMIKLP
jgi:serine protease AprX